ncbi:MAG: SDR family oxidoreductase [Anaerolineales bacterium]
MEKKDSLILVTGATGYIGGRLVPRLIENGYPVRCLARDPNRLLGRPWLEQVEIVEGDALVEDSLVNAMKDVRVAYYLIHGLQGGKVYAERDIQAARNFSSAAYKAGVERIIYLGELVDPSDDLSPYLRSRHETGYILRQGGVPVTEFRAGIVIGSGSLLFEMIRYLTEHQPVLVCPRWFFTKSQPIAIRNVLDYLLAELNCPECSGRLIEIGGPGILSYAEMCREYADVRGFKRLMIPAPVYAPLLSAWWVHMLTPLHWRALLPLIEGLHSESIVQDDSAKKLFPNIALLDYKTAVQLALGRIADDNVETSWSDALVTSEGDNKPYSFVLQDGMMIEERNLVVDLPASKVHKAYMGLGGERGWLYLDWTWVIRGWVDKLFGGVGLHRGRRNPDQLYVGESLDFWRVEAVEPDHLLRLRAEMKVPGKAWLQFTSFPQSDGKTLLKQTAYFAPRGLTGLIYWYSLYPIHTFIFSGLIKKIAERATRLEKEAANS